MSSSKTHLALFLGTLAFVSALVALWVGSAATRLNRAVAEQTGESAVAVASAADEGYCTGDLKRILRRVLTSCGLVQGGSQRGCQPLQAKSVAAMSGGDFNARGEDAADSPIRQTCRPSSGSGDGRVHATSGASVMRGAPRPFWYPRPADAVDDEDLACAWSSSASPCARSCSAR